MKNLLIALLVFMVGCGKTTQPETITIEELKTKYGIDLIAAWDIQFGMARNPNSKKPNKNDQVTLSETFFTWSGGSFTTVDNPKFAGVNNHTLMTSICTWFIYEGSPAQTLTCNNATGSGQIMAWYTDWSDNVYRSNLINIP